MGMRVEQVLVEESSYKRVCENLGMIDYII